VDVRRVERSYGRIPLFFRERTNGGLPELRRCNRVSLVGRRADELRHAARCSCGTISISKVGTVGDVPASMSRIQLGTEGRYKDNGFVAVGRIVYEYERGHWSEWHSPVRRLERLAQRRTGQYAVTRQAESPGEIQPAASYQPGQTVALNRARYTVGSITRAVLGCGGRAPIRVLE
jgi:hypothetical protein